MEQFITTYLPSSIFSVVISFILSVFAGIIYSSFYSLKVWDLRKEILRNAKDDEILTEERVRAKILKKNPSAFDYEKKMIIFTSVSFVVFFGLTIVIQYFFGKDIANKLYLNQPNSNLSSSNLNSYQDNSGKFSFKYSSKYKLEKTEFGGIIYSEEHRRIFKENQSFGEVPPLQISFEVIKDLPKNGAGAPQIKYNKIGIGNFTVFKGEVIPSGMPNIHYFVMLPEGYLDLGIDPVFFYTTPNDNQILGNISNELEQEIDLIIRNLEVK